MQAAGSQDVVAHDLDPPDHLVASLKKGDRLQRDSDAAHTNGVKNPQMDPNQVSEFSKLVWMRGTRVLGLHRNILMGALLGEGQTGNVE